jgi:magnesium transporter
MAEVAWTDLLDPDEEELRKHSPRQLHERALTQLLRPAEDHLVVRPSIEGHGDYVFGVLLAAKVLPEHDRLIYQEIDLVLARDRLLTVRKTPPGEEPFDISTVRAVCDVRDQLAPGMVAYHVVNEVAERYLDLIDALDDEIDEVEAGMGSWPARRVHKRISELRRDLLGIRRTLAPTRDAVRGVVDGRTDLEDRPLFRREVFPNDVELHFAEVHDKLLRASEALEFARDLVASVRDYHQSRIAAEQNEVVKKLGVVASLLLFPTFIVGVYGQNFDHMPELDWYLGYAFSWGIIVLSTIAQLAFFRWRKWI